MNRQNSLYSLSPRYEEERPQKAGAGAGEVVTGSADGHVRPGIGGIKASNLYGFFVAALEVIYIAVRRCGAIPGDFKNLRQLAVTFRCVRPLPPVPSPPHPIATARSPSLAGVDDVGRATS
jgi:hypothetical protein